MTGDTYLRHYQSGGRLVLSDQADLDKAQASGRWIASDVVVEADDD